MHEFMDTLLWAVVHCTQIQTHTHTHTQLLSFTHSATRTQNFNPPNLHTNILLPI